MRISKEFSVSVRKLENGWSVEFSQYEGEGEWVTREYVFLSREDVLAKVDELTKDYE